MLRILAVAFAVTVGASIVAHGNRWVIYVAFFGTIAVFVIPLLTGDAKLKCPACRKRIKLGASACHHCGRSISP